eukprot:160883-Rhodomonas_salina.1
MVLQLYYDRNRSLRGTISYLQLTPELAGSALGTIDRKMLRRWVVAYKNLQPGQFLKTRGRLRVEEFEMEVLAECLIADHVAPAGGVQGTHDLTIVASDLHSYAMVQNAAKHVQAMDKWHTHPVVSRLQFKDHWTHSFLLRHGMGRKRVTADRKGTHPSDEEIRTTMERCQAIICENHIALKFTLNTDETGVFYGQGPRNQWVPEGKTKGGIRGTFCLSS